MAKTIATFILKFVLLILAQAVIFNSLVLFNVAVPMVFIYIIISMPISWNTNTALTIGFIAGLTVDIFSNTLGINALSCTILAFVRKPVFHLYVQRDEDLGGLKPSQKTLGTPAFLKYAFTMSIAYCIMAFGIDAFAIFSPMRLLLQIIASSIYTFILIYALDTILTRQK